LQSDGTVDRVSARRLVGRLCNLSQVAPELRYKLHGGYAITEVSWKVGGIRVFDPTIKLKHGSPAFENWSELLRVATEVLRANAGAAMAPRRRFQSRLMAGSLTCATDASGIDGVGGYAYMAGSNDTVYLMSAEWPADILSALHATASQPEAELRRASSAEAAPHLPMPAGELFGSWLMPTLVSEVVAFKRCISIGDCQPAVGVINKLHSNKQAMRSLADAARASPWAWLGVHVVRTLNMDPDKLSHPQLASEVAAEATAANPDLQVVWVTPQQRHWDVARAAIAEGRLQRGGKRKRKASA
jgi:hypothetical protein